MWDVVARDHALYDILVLVVEDKQGVVRTALVPPGERKSVFVLAAGRGQRSANRQISTIQGPDPSGQLRRCHKRNLLRAQMSRGGAMKGKRKRGMLLSRFDAK
jgi:hypothetical protein